MQALDGIFQHGAVLLERGACSVSPASTPALLLGRFSRPQCGEVEPKPMAGLLDRRGRDQNSGLRHLDFEGRQI